MSGRDKKKIAFFSPISTGIRGWRSLTEAIVSVLKKNNTVDIFSGKTEADAIAFNEFSWRNLKQPYDLVIYNLCEAEDYSFILPFLLTHPGWVILRTPSISSSLWRMHSLDGTGQDFIDEMNYCYGREGALLGHIAWRGMWGKALSRQFPALRMIAEGSLWVSCLDRWIVEATREQSALETINLIPPPFPLSDSVDNQGIPTFLTLYSSEYPLLLSEVCAALSELPRDQLEGFRFVICTETGWEAETRKVVSRHNLENYAEVLIPDSMAEIKNLFASSDVLLYLEDPALPVEGLPIYAASTSGCITILTDTRIRLDLPDDVFPRFRFAEGVKGLLSVINGLFQKPRYLVGLKKEARDYYAKTYTVDTEGSEKGRDESPNSAFIKSLDNTLLKVLELKESFTYPVGYPEHLISYKSRLYRSIKEKLGKLPENSDIERVVRDITGLSRGQ